jgi:hypothetical protein
VDHILAAGLVQSIRNLDGVLQYLLRHQRPLEQTGGQRLALDVLNHQKINSILMADVIQCTGVRIKTFLFGSKRLNLFAGTNLSKANALYRS